MPYGVGMTKTPRIKYIARPVIRGRERLGTQGVLVGEYTSFRNATRHMIDKRGRVGVTYNVYVRPANGTLPVKTGEHRCYRPADIRPDWLGDPVTLPV